MGLKWEWTIPNILSLCRIGLVPVFSVLYLMSEDNPKLLSWAIFLLVFSGLTDMLDGLIARKCNQISEIGKILDPIADKLTQVSVVFCLAICMPRLWPLLVLCFLKELLQSIGAALLLLRKQSEVQSAQWYGKVNTVVFYITMALYVMFPPEPSKPLFFDWNMPSWLFLVLATIVAVLMVFSFFRYCRVFIEVSHKTPDRKGEANL